MGLPVTQGAYNLLEEKWIPVLNGDGTADRVGICQALTDARTIRQIAASNPMDRVALLRFLSAVLMWCKEDAKSSLAALDEKSTGIPENWLAKLQEHKTAFNLLGDDSRFYQDASLKGKVSRPIGDLLVEFPGADSVNHMRHVVHDHDSSYGFCPACCAMGILRLSVWAPANRYYPASVNPGSAAYAFIEGKNLFQTLRANLPEINPQADQAPWLGNEQPDSPDAVARLAWRPRKLWLNVGSENDACANCGSFGELITSLCNEGGWPTPITSSQEFARAVETEFKNLGYSAKGKDQANKNAKKVVEMAPIILKCRMDDLRKACGQSNSQPQAAAPTTQTDAQEIARLFHRLILMNDECAQAAIKALTKKPNEEEQKKLGDGDMRAKKFWDADPHLLRDGEAISLPGLGEDAAMHSSRFWRDALRLQRGQVGRVTAIGPVVNKFTFQDSVSVTLPDASASVKDRAELSGACSGELSDLFKRVTQNPQRQHPEIGAAVKLLTPNAEAQIRDRLSRLNASTGDNATEDKAFLYEVYAPVVEQVIASVTPGSPLRRYATRNHAQDLLNEKIKELVEKPNQPSNAGTPAAVPGKPKRGRKKGGSK
ncbi:MAG: type I-E CRISPR-associated protein Cse1/CasA [Syntrophobacteraceae bacterium]